MTLVDTGDGEVEVPRAPETSALPQAPVLSGNLKKQPARLGDEPVKKETDEEKRVLGTLSPLMSLSF